MKKSFHSEEAFAVSAHLRHLRRIAGLTQRQLAARLGVVFTEISKMESHDRRIDLVNFFEFCSGVGASASREAAALFRLFKEIAAKRRSKGAR